VVSDLTRAYTDSLMEKHKDSACRKEFSLYGFRAMNVWNCCENSAWPILAG